MKPPRHLLTRITMCTACKQAETLAVIDAISATLATITPRAPKAELTAIPPGHHIEHGRPVVARGAYKPRMAGRGDAPTDTHAARSTDRVCGPDRRALLSYASRGHAR